MSHRARKRFGQNFLHDPGVIDKIVRSINPQPSEHLVEIGPGQGAITVELLKRVGDMDAVELDRDLLEPLQTRCAPIGTLNLHSADALKMDFSELQEDARPLRMVGNLPYNISTPILFHLLEYRNVIQDMHFMLQKEVVDRMAAGPGSKTYGRLSVMLQAYCNVQPLFDIGPGAFNPPPKVDSSIVRLTPLPAPLVAPEQQTNLRALVTQAFSQRRKTLRNTLKDLLDEDEIRSCNIDPIQRAETLSLDEFAQLAKCWGKKQEQTD